MTIGFACGCSGPMIPAIFRGGNVISKHEVWAAVQTESAQQDLDPRFVYSVVFAESSFDANADTGYARGIMQISKAAWTDTTELSYSMAWDWRTNIAVGTAYLGWCRDQLVAEGKFTYPLLAASYRYGYYRVKGRQFRIDRLQPPRNRVYKKLFAGEIAAIRPPSPITI